MDIYENTVGEKTFLTEIDTEYVKKQSYRSSIVIFFVLTLLASLGFLVAWQTFVFLETAVIFSCAFTAIKTKDRAHEYLLRFEADILYIEDLTAHETFKVYDVPGDDFVIWQTKKEKELDYCSLTIKNTVFALGGVKNCSGLKAYISQNYRIINKRK